MRASGRHGKRDGIALAWPFPRDPVDSLQTDSKRLSSALTILHVTAPAEVGGLESVVRMLAVGHSRLGHRVHVAGAVGPATLRSRPARRRAIQPSSSSPRPIGSRLPTILPISCLIWESISAIWALSWSIFGKSAL